MTNIGTVTAGVCPCAQCGRTVFPGDPAYVFRGQFYHSRCKDYLLAVTEPTITLACFRAMLDAVMAYVPLDQQANARAAVREIRIAYESRPEPKIKVSG